MPVIAGGGRWAQVYVQELYPLLAADQGLHLVTACDRGRIFEWAKRVGCAERLTISQNWPDVAAEDDFAIVVNSADRHVDAASIALGRGYSVLVEKPFTLSCKHTEALIGMARVRELTLSAAHVFLFAPYMARFADFVRSRGPVDSIEIEWNDRRYINPSGESNRWDPRVPIVADVSPHIMSILWLLAGEQTLQLENVKATNGGAHVDAAFTYGDAPVHIQLMRSGEQRVRRVQIKQTDGICELDFSDEPGIIRTDGGARSAAPEWGQVPGPISSMLSAFIGKVTGGKGDWRLAPSIALRVNRLIDDLMPLYRASQLENVVQLISSGLDRVDWLDYALHETVLFDARLRGVELEEAVRQLRISLVDLSSPQVRMALQLRLGLMRSHEGEG